MNKRILDSCLKIARTRNNEKHHPEFGAFMHFSFVVIDNKIIEYATNHSGVTRYSKFYDRVAKTHAEAAAYNRAKGLMRRGEKFEMVNIRLNKTGELRNSAPCSGCHMLLQLFGCTKVWYTTKAGTFEKLSVRS